MDIGTALDHALAGQVRPQPEPAIGYEIGSGPLIPNSSYQDFIGAGGAKGNVVGNERQLVPLDELVLMRRKDGQARALLRLFMLPIKLAFSEGEWVRPESRAGDREGSSPAPGPGIAEKLGLEGAAAPDRPAPGEEEAQFANLMWTLPEYSGGMSVSGNQFVRHMLLALADGFSVFEEVRKIPFKGPLRGMVVLDRLSYRDPRTLRFVVDDRGQRLGVRQWISGVGAREVFIPRDKMIYYACQEEENPYYGVSLMESAWHHYDIKRKLYYIAHIAAQFGALPGRVGTVPRNANPATVAKFQEAIRDFAFNTSMTVPEGYSLAPFNAGGQFNFLDLINHHNQMMSLSVLAGFLNQENRQVLIDNGRADASADLFVMSVQSIITEIEAVLSFDLMPKYVEWNFGSSMNSPVFKFGQLTDSGRDAIKEIFQSVVTASVLNCTPEFVREAEEKLADRLGFDVDYEEIKRKEAENAAANAAAQEFAAQPGQAEEVPPEVGSSPGEFQSPEQVAASAGGIDDLVKMANELLFPHG